jgi:hypothetical protein
MSQLYKIGNKILFVNMVTHITFPHANYSGMLGCLIHFVGGGSDQILMHAGKDGRPSYHNPKGDFTDEGSDFYRVCKNEVDLLTNKIQELRVET